MTYLFAVALLSLFSGIELKTGLVILRPFDAIAAVLGVLLVIRLTRQRLSLTSGLLLALPFLAWHVTSALSVDTVNGIREALQVTVLTTFAVAIVAFRDDIDYAKFGRLMLIGLLIVMIYNVVWHISQGYWGGWKRLDEPKMAFTFLPLVLALVIALATTRRSYLLWLLWFTVGVVILFSGERKALMVFGLLTAALIGQGRFYAMAAIIAAGVLILGMLAAFGVGGNLSKRLDSLLNPLETGEQLTASEMAAGKYPESMSNAQRRFAFDYGSKLIAQHPVTGIGTNAYLESVQKRFNYLPNYLTIGIHNDFFRVLVENGLIGFVLYAGAVVLSIGRYAAFLMRATARSLITRAQKGQLLLTPYIPLLFYVGFEGSGMEAMVVFVLMCVFPDMFGQALAIRRRSGYAYRGTVPALVSSYPKGAMS